MAVSVVYRLPLLDPVAVPVGVVALQDGAWSPSRPMLTASTVTGALSNGTAQVAIGSVAIDRVYVDPRMR